VTKITRHTACQHGAVRLSSSCSSRHLSSSRQICGRWTVLVWTRSTTESGVWCSSVFTRLLSETSVSWAWNSVSSTPRQEPPTISRRNMQFERR